MTGRAETPAQRTGRIVARVATIALAIAAVAVKLSVDKAMAQLAEADRDDARTSPWR